MRAPNVYTSAAEDSPATTALFTPAWVMFAESIFPWLFLKIYIFGWNESVGLFMEFVALKKKI